MGLATVCPIQLSALGVVRLNNSSQTDRVAKERPVRLSEHFEGPSLRGHLPLPGNGHAGWSPSRIP